MPSMQIHLPTLSLADAEHRLVELALITAGSIVGAAQLLNITNHAVKRRIIAHRIEWPRSALTSSTAVLKDDAKLDVDDGIVVREMDLGTVERKLLERALKLGGSMIAAAKLLGTTRHAVKRRIAKHGIRWQSVHPAHAHVQMGGGL